MDVKERGDVAAGVESGRFVVGDAGDAQDLEEDALVIVHERMSGVGVIPSRRERRGRVRGGARAGKPEGERSDQDHRTGGRAGSGTKLKASW